MLHTLRKEPIKVMTFPNMQHTLIEQEKIVEYLLNATHPDNGRKASFFQALGFSRRNWQTMSAALQKLAETSTVVKSMESPYGYKYILRGRIETPVGTNPSVQTVWIMDRGRNVLRFVTAYPQE